MLGVHDTEQRGRDAVGLSVDMVTLPRIIGGLTWLTLSLLVALLVAGEGWFLVAALLLAGGGALFAYRDLRGVTLLWILGMPSLLVFPNNLLASVPIVNADRALWGLIVLSLLLRHLLKRDEPMGLMAIEKAMVLFALIIVVSLALRVTFRDHPLQRDDVIMAILGYAMPYISFALARRQVWDEQALGLLLAGFTVVGVYNAVVGVLQSYFAVHLFDATYLEINNLGRGVGAFGGAWEFGGVLAVILLLTLLQYARARSRGRRLLCLAGAAACAVGVAVSKTRGPWLATLLGLAVVYREDPRIRPLLRIGAILAVVGAMVAFPFFVASDWWQRTTDVTSIYNRIALYATAAHMVLAHPLLGVGFARYGFALPAPEYIVPVGGIGGEWAASVGVPHNELLHVVILTGLPGLIVDLTVLVLAYRLLAAAARREHQEPEPIAELATYMKGAFVVVVTVGMFVDLGFSSYFTILFFFLLGLVSSPRRCRPDPAPVRASLAPPPTVVHASK